VSWHSGGYGNREDPPERDWGPRRYWMKLGTEGNVTFVDDDTQKLVVEVEGQKVRMDLPFMYHEHQLYLNGNWFNYFTCCHNQDDGSGGKVKCPLCLAGEKRCAKLSR